MTAQRSSAEHLPSVHQLKVGLEGMKPPVWRRLVVPSDVTLGSLHDVIQVAFGWQDIHLHAFEDRVGGRYAPPEDLDIAVFDEEEAVLADVLPRTGEVLAALADAVRPLDKALAKRLRKAAFKAGSAK